MAGGVTTIAEMKAMVKQIENAAKSPCVVCGELLHTFRRSPDVHRVAAWDGEGRLVVQVACMDHSPWPQGGHP